MSTLDYILLSDTYVSAFWGSVECGVEHQVHVFLTKVKQNYNDLGPLKFYVVRYLPKIF